MDKKEIIEGLEAIRGEFNIKAPYRKFVVQEAINTLKAKTEPVAKSPSCNDVLSCACCGGKMVYIRGRHPGMDNRLVCPTCMAETLDDIKERLRTDYGQAMQKAR